MSIEFIFIFLSYQILNFNFKVKQENLFRFKLNNIIPNKNTFKLSFQKFKFSSLINSLDFIFSLKLIFHFVKIFQKILKYFQFKKDEKLLCAS